MRNLSAPTSAQYQEEFNKELSERLKQVRQAQPNHVPVFAMKYKNASKYLIQDLQEPLALFPKKFPLNSLHQIVQKQSLKFCLGKLKDDNQVKKQGENFKLPQFYFYTISMLKPEEENKIEKAIKQKSNARPIGTFVRLNLEMSFEEAFEKYGRENVLTIVYTDAKQVTNDYTKTAARVQKWLIRVIVFILILVLVPFLMKSEEEKFDTTSNIETKSKSSENRSTRNNDKIYPEDTLDAQNQLDIDVADFQPISFTSEKTFEYDEESI